MKCPACQTENPPDSQYCNKCGSSIELSTSPTLSYSPSQETALGESLKFNPGEKFGDRYTIIEEIGQGGMGRVYKAKDHELGTTVVLKMIRPELTSRPGMIDQFRKETLLGRSVSHENVVRIHDLGEVNKIRYISMDFIKGENLAELMKTSGSLALSTCLQIALQVCQALKAAHEKGIIHQDLKPQNIMIDNSGKVYVTDFGLAKSISLSPAHRPGKISGTPKYFSPEQARGEESDQRSDIYSLGVILYEMLAGTPPFKADTAEGYIQKHSSERPPLPSKSSPSIPPACEKIILKCLEKKKEDRYQSVDELLKDLEAQKAHVLGAAATGRSRRWQKTLVISALMLAAAVGIYEFTKRTIPLPSPGRVAVMYAINNTGDKSLDAQFRWVIPNYLTTALGQSKSLTVLPQDKLMQILNDMGQLNDERPLAKALDRISDAARIGYLIIPTFTKTGENLLISVIVRKAKTDLTVGEPLTTRGKADDVTPLIDELSAKLRPRLSLSPAEIAEDRIQGVGSITTASREAARYFAEGQELYARRDFRASVDALEKAVQKDPNYALAHMELAIDFQYLGEYDKFRRSLQRALDLSDRVSEKDRYYIQAYAANVLNESPLAAIEIYKKMIKLYPGDEKAYSLLGAIYRNLEEWELAIDQYDKVQMINPEFPFLVENRAFMYPAMGRYKEAIDLCAAHIGDPSVESFCARQLPLLYLIQGQYERANAELKKALMPRPDDLRLIELAGVYHILTGDSVAARQDFEKVKQKGEEKPGAFELEGRLLLVRVHWLRGEYRQAERECSEGIDLAEKSGRAYDVLEFRSLLAYANLQMGQFSRAAEVSRAALEIAKTTFNWEDQKLALHQLGLALLGMGRVEEARKAAQQLRDLTEGTSFPKSARRYEHLVGQISLKEGHPEQATAHFEKAVSLLPQQMEIYDEQAYYYDGLASALFQSGDWPKAIDSYRSIQDLTTGRVQWGDIYARSYYWLGKSYQKSGRSAEAKANYLRFLELWQNANAGLPEVAEAKQEMEILSGVRH